MTPDFKPQPSEDNSNPTPHALSPPQAPSANITGMQPCTQPKSCLPQLHQELMLPALIPTRSFSALRPESVSVFMSVPSQSAVISSLGNYLKQLNSDCPFLMSPATVPPLLTYQPSGQREWRPREPPSPGQPRLDLVHLEVCFLRILWNVRWKLLASLKNHSQPSHHCCPGHYSQPPPAWALPAAEVTLLWFAAYLRSRRKLLSL